MKEFKTPLMSLAAVPLIALMATCASAGTLSYTAIPGRESDAGSGIGTDHTYTSAVAAGDAAGNDHAVGGVKLFALPASGTSASANDITVDITSGSLENDENPAADIRADGGVRQVFSHMITNPGAADGSRQEIAIDPGGLTIGKVYNLRVYITKSSDVDREVNLSFAGDGQPFVETQYFNEDDATTSAGHFSNARQAYYIDYRFNWDGKTSPGVIITQKSGSAPFCLYAVTNQESEAGDAADKPVKIAKARTRHVHHAAASSTEEPTPPPVVTPEVQSALDKLEQNYRNGYMTEDAYNTQRRILLKNSNE